MKKENQKFLPHDVARDIGIGRGRDESLLVFEMSVEFLLVVVRHCKDF